MGGLVVHESSSSLEHQPNGPLSLLVTNYLLTLLLHAIHSILRAYFWSKRWTSKLVEGGVWLWSVVVNEKRLLEREVVAELDKSLPKRPLHIAFALAPNENPGESRNQYEKILHWCNCLNLKSATFYHPSHDQYSEEYLKGSDLEIQPNLVGPQASHQGLIETCQHFAVQQAKQPRDPLVLTPEAISDHLVQKYYKVADPDLLIVFTGPPGGPHILNGFPLWQIRLTEIMFVDGTMNEFTLDKFRQCLKRYARCEQRFGN